MVERPTLVRYVTNPFLEIANPPRATTGLQDFSSLERELFLTAAPFVDLGDSVYQNVSQTRDVLSRRVYIYKLIEMR